MGKLDDKSEHLLLTLYDHPLKHNTKVRIRFEYDHRSHRIDLVSADEEIQGKGYEPACDTIFFWCESYLKANEAVARSVARFQLSELNT